MFKYLLAMRYLRTRYIALASILSVMLGVATMIVVNSVMSGFRVEMYNRLHGILSDIVVESHGMEGIRDPEAITGQIRRAVGNDIAGMTTSVQIPALLSFQLGEDRITRQINLIGIDDATYANVSDFSKFLLHPQNREQLSFHLREDGYDSRLPDAGWSFRRLRVQSQRLYEQHMRELEQKWPSTDVPRLGATSPNDADSDRLASSDTDAPSSPSRHDSGVDHEHEPGRLEGHETTCPHCGESLATAPAAHEWAGLDDPTLGDPPTEAMGHVFDELTEQHPGIVLGIAISSQRRRESDGTIQDYFWCRPGDDIQVTFPSSGTPPTAVHSTFTVVDFYESKMSEYDSTIAFCPLSKLQSLRGMVDRESGKAAVTSIQLRLREGASLVKTRDRLRAEFPLMTYRYRVDSWKDLQGPLLAAVQWETAILNVLLFLIIGVAGFGIFATFFMIVVEKTKDIGILKSLGAPSSSVMSIFVSYGFALGTVGSGVGMVLGVLFVWNINKIAALIEQLTGQEVFDPTVYYFQEIPTILNPFTIAWIVAGAMFIAVLASIMPAMRAARMHPVEALRYE